MNALLPTMLVGEYLSDSNEVTWLAAILYRLYLVRLSCTVHLYNILLAFTIYTLVVSIQILQICFGYLFIFQRHKTIHNCTHWYCEL